MPTGSPSVHEYWCNKGPSKGSGDTNALRYLWAMGLEPKKGGMFFVPRYVDLGKDGWSAINYLADEWDYDWKYVEDEG